MINRIAPRTNGIISAVPGFPHFVVVGILLVTSAQGQQKPAESTNDFIFRMAQKDGAKTGCILVKQSGGFHSERTHGNEVEVSEGTLSNDSMSRLNNLLSDASFRELLPEAVSSSLLLTGLDELIISVPGTRRWMSLRFVEGLGNDRNQDLLRHFLKWENDAKKSPHRNLREQSSRNNCLPPAPLDLKTRPEPE